MAYSKNPNTAVGEPQQVETNQVGVKLNPTATVSNVNNEDPKYRSPIRDRMLEYGDSSLCMFKNYEDQALWHMQWDSPYKEERLKHFGFRVVYKSTDGHLFKESYFRDDFGGRIITGGVSPNGQPAMVLYIRPYSYELEDNKTYADYWKERDRGDAPEKDPNVSGGMRELSNTPGFAGMTGTGLVTDTEGSRSWGKLTT